MPKASEARTYDLDGNLTTDSRWTYTWDGENRLVKLTPKTGAPNVTLWYSYDYRGRRIGRKVADARSSPTKTTITGFVYDDWNPVAEWDAVATGTGTPTTGSYVLRRTQLWGLDLGGGGATPYGRTNFQDAGGVGGLLAVSYHDTTNRHYLPGYDANGNIISWSAGDGELLQRMDYDPFGNRIFEEKLATSTNGIASLGTVPSYGFSTKPQDTGSDFLYYGYRYYDPMTGRWPSRDPIEEAGGINLYGFLSNSAVRCVDLLGGKVVTTEGEEYRGSALKALSLFGHALCWDEESKETGTYVLRLNKKPGDLKGDDLKLGSALVEAIKSETDEYKLKYGSPPRYMDGIVYWSPTSKIDIRVESGVVRSVKHSGQIYQIYENEDGVSNSTELLWHELIGHGVFGKKGNVFGHEKKAENAYGAYAQTSATSWNGYYDGAVYVENIAKAKADPNAKPRSRRYYTKDDAVIYGWLSK